MERFKCCENVVLPLAKMLSGTNAFEISDIQEAETEGRTNQTTWMDVTMLHCVD
jgi:hypothetical protein